MIRTLLFSTLFPSSARPFHGLFVETRLRELLKSGKVETRVVAPVPWFPFTGARFGAYGKYAATPRCEQRDGVEIHHPRYFLPPKVGMNVAPWLLAQGAWPTIRRLQAEGFDFDLIDAHYYYPDGVAAALLARRLGKPFVVTARGSDINLIAQFARPRRLILQTAAAANASIGVCQALCQSLADLGAAPEKLQVFRNGVDLERFQPVDRGAARARLSLPLTAKVLLSVGNLIELKGHHIAIEALARLPSGVFLLIAGAGPDREKLAALAQALGVGERVRFLGQVVNTELKWCYGAADALVLCSSREGWANVLLEAMACGTPVLATPVGGSAEIVTAPAAGRLLEARSPAALASACMALLEHPPDTAAVRRHAEGFSWEATTQAQLGLFQKILGVS